MTISARRLRSFFIAPANRPDLVGKFPRFDADFSVIDLEDGTPPAEKVTARTGLADLVAGLRSSGLSGLLGVRVNEPWSDWYLDDIAAVASLAIDVILVPKTESPDQLFPVAHAIRRAERETPRGRTILAGIESVRGVTRAADIFAAYPEIGSAYFGAEDFISDIGGVRTRGSAEVQFARASVLAHAKAVGLMAIDQPVADVRDDALFRSDAEAARAMGYDGKVCLLPRQVEIANDVFTPSADDLAYAERLLAASAEAAARGIGTIDFEGKMVDGPLIKRAQRIVALGGGPAAIRQSSIRSFEIGPRSFE